MSKFKVKINGTFQYETIVDSDNRMLALRDAITELRDLREQWELGELELEEKYEMVYDYKMVDREE